MNNVLVLIGLIAGVAGVVICAVAVLVRFSGEYSVGAYQVSTLLLAGVTAMVAGCLCFLWTMVGRSERSGGG